MPPKLRSGIPRHEQISTWLREEIESGSFQVDQRLPSENDLCQRFEVSRITVRRALQTLEADGFIYRRQGLGSFAADRRVRQGLVRLTDFHQDMALAGLAASSRVLCQREVPCPEPVAPWLGIPCDTPVLRVDRLRLGDGEPVALDRTWFPRPWGRLLENRELGEDTFYRILEEEYGIPIVSGRYRISADRADPEAAGSLGVEPGDALLVIERLSRTSEDRPVYFQRRLYRSDRVAYELELARDPDARGTGESPDHVGMPLRDFHVVFDTGE
jgi:GntR family transcriptional regulator